MPLQANALLDVADVTSYMKEKPPSAEKTTLLESLINRASDMVETYIGGPVINKSLTVKLDGSGTDELDLPYFPVQSVSSVLVDGSAASVEFYPIGTVYRVDGGLFPVGRQNIQVTFTAGYGAGKETIPQDIRQAALLIVHFWYKRDSADYSQTFGESDVIVSGARFPTSALRMLDPYRRRNMGVI